MGNGKLTKEQKLEKVLKEVEKVNEQISKFKKLAGDSTPEEILAKSSLFTLQEELERLNHEADRLGRVKEGF